MINRSKNFLESWAKKEKYSYGKMIYNMKNQGKKKGNLIPHDFTRIM